MTRSYLFVPGDRPERMEAIDAITRAARVQRLVFGSRTKGVVDSIPASRTKFKDLGLQNQVLFLAV